jgi:hypothetical protein
MTDSTAKKSHYLRNRDQISVFRIVRKKDVEKAKTVLANFKNFSLKNISTPEAVNNNL